MGCARCHDHKFDPISQAEFYQFLGFFNSVNEQGVYTETRGNVPPLVDAADAAGQPSASKSSRPRSPPPRQRGDKKEIEKLTKEKDAVSQGDHDA